MTGTAARAGYAGFTSRGIAAKSAATVWQSSIGLVGKGSLFAFLQSAGATGRIATVRTLGSMAVLTGVGIQAGNQLFKKIPYLE